jgi:hypothetical protein
VKEPASLSAGFRSDVGGRRNEEVIVKKSRENAEDGIHGASNPPTLLLRSARDEKSDSEAAVDRQSGLEIGESVSAWIAGLVAALRD